MRWLKRKYYNLQLFTAAWYVGTPDDMADQIMDLLGVTAEEVEPPPVWRGADWP